MGPPGLPGPPGKSGQKGERGDKGGSTVSITFSFFYQQSQSVSASHTKRFLGLKTDKRTKKKTKSINRLKCKATKQNLMLIGAILDWKMFKFI